MILKFILNPKNTKLLVFSTIVILILLLLNQCNSTNKALSEVEYQKTEIKRVSNNYAASKDSIENFKIDNNTWGAKKLGYEITINELNGEYSSLLGDFDILRNGTPRTIVKTEYIIKEIIDSVLVYTAYDSSGSNIILLEDSVNYDKFNYRYLKGEIPYQLVFDPIDSVYKLSTNYGMFDIKLGMNLNIGLFKDEETKEISIIASTDYPNVFFTNINGANIINNPKNKDMLKQARKPWGIGVNVGYGAIYNTKSSQVNLGPYFGVGISYSPKFLQW